MAQGFRRLLGDAVVYGATTAGAQSVQILMVPLYTRALTPAAYGAVEAVIALTAIAGLVLGMQVDSAMARYYYQAARDERRGLAGTGLALIAIASLLGMVALIWAARPIAAFLTGSEADAGAVTLAFLSIPGRLIATYLLLIFRLERQRGRYALVGVGWVVLSVLASIAFVAGLGWGLRGVFTAMLLSDAAAALAAVALARGYLSLSLSWSASRKMLGYGLPLVPAASGQWGLRYLDRFFILALLSRGHLGVYALAVQVSSIVLLLDRAFALAWTPFAMELIGTRDAASVYAKALIFYLLVVSACGLAISVFATEIVGLVAPAVYAPAAALVPVLVAGWMGRGVFRVVSTGVSVAARTGYSLAAFAAGLIVNAGLLAALVPVWGLQGAAAAAAGGTLVTAVLGYRFAQRLFPVPYQPWKAVALVAIFSGAIVAARSVELGAGGAALVLIKAGILIAGLAALAVVALDAADRRKVAALIGRRGPRRTGTNP